MRRERRPGFTLIEVVVASACLVFILATMVAIVGASDRYLRRSRAQTDLVALADSVHRFADDTGAWPQSLGELATNTRALAGWRGPYVTSQGLTRGGVAIRDYGLDPWRNAYVYTLPAGVSVDGLLNVRCAQIRSPGEDRTLNTGDDLVILIAAPATPGSSAGAQTRERLARLNEALGAYQRNQVGMATPLTDNFSTTLGRLRTAGYVQAAPPLAADTTDGWGQTFYMDGLQVYSTMIQTGSEPTGPKQ